MHPPASPDTDPVATQPPEWAKPWSHLLFGPAHPELPEGRLVALNATRVLARRWPGMEFGVVCDGVHVADTLRVDWLILDDGPTAKPGFAQRVLDALQVFERGAWNGMTERYENHGQQASAFVRAFGGADYVSARGRAPTEEQRARIRQARLAQAMPDPCGTGPRARL